MPNSKKYYKVVYNDGGELLSCCRCEIVLPSRYRAKYVKGKWTKPTIPKSKLFIFDSLENADHFVDNEFSHANKSRMEIWECEVTNPEKCEWKHRPYTRSNDVWRLITKNIAPEFSATSIPTGSMWCSSLKLIKKVKDYVSN